MDCAAFHLTRDYRDDEAIPIGKACRNMQIIPVSYTHLFNIPIMICAILMSQVL